MPAQPNPDVLVASNAPDLVAAMRAGLDNLAEVRTAASAEASLAALPAPALLLLDAELPGMPIEQLLAALRAGANDRPFPIVLISDQGMPEWRDRIEEGVIDDLVPRTMPAFHWRVRVEAALRTFRHLRELDHLRETALNRETDPATGIYNRPALLAMLFRETDRVQRMNTPLSLMLFDIDDFAHWNGRLSSPAIDKLLKQVVGRIQRLLRSYDLFGRSGFAGFLLGLPGCSPVNATSLAERIRAEVFSAPFRLDGLAVRLTASFGIASSHGRSPLIVLREAEHALLAAKAAGPETIRNSRDYPAGSPAPADFLSLVAVTDHLTR